MIAAKLGRDENIEELMSVTVEEADNDMDLEDADDVIEGSKERKPGQVKRVMIDGKHKKTTKAPIHYAAKNGHEVGLILQIHPPPRITFSQSSSIFAARCSIGRLNLLQDPYQGRMWA